MICDSNFSIEEKIAFILKAYDANINDLISSLGEPYKDNEYKVKPDDNGVWWIEHKHVGSGEPLKQLFGPIYTPVEAPIHTNVKMSFKDAPVGARFKYPNSDKIWIKINSYPKGKFNDGNGLICSWKGNVNDYQEHCSFVDEEDGIDFNTLIELI